MPAASEIPQSVTDQGSLTSLHTEEWLKNDVFQTRWWILIALIIVFIAVWWILLDKSRLKEVCLYAAVTAIIALGINEYGEELILWDYPVDVIPIFPPLSSINLIILPLAYSLVYQFFKTRWHFLWAALAMTAILCFIVEPLLQLGGLFELLNWQYWWNFPIYVVMALFVRKATKIVLKTAQRHAAAGR